MKTLYPANISPEAMALLQKGCSTKFVAAVVAMDLIRVAKMGGSSLPPPTSFIVYIGVYGLGYV